MYFLQRLSGQMPDNRATVDTEEKITSLLVSAYPNSHYALIAEMSSDNTDKNGLSSYTAINKLQEQAALWEDITERRWIVHMTYGMTATRL